MSSRLTFEVRQRMASDPAASRELAFFTDASMAQQVVDACYKQVFQIVMKSPFIPDDWVTTDVSSTLRTNGFDRWWADQLNAEFGLFFIVSHTEYNHVPVIDSDFIMRSNDSFKVVSTPTLLVTSQEVPAP